MRELIKTIYRAKIKTMFYFGLGYSEVSNIVSMVKDVAIILTASVLIFKVHLSVAGTVLVCLGSFIGFTVIGLILKKSGMSDYATKLSNSISPELQNINKIVEHLKIK